MDAVAGMDDEGFRDRSAVGRWTAAEVLAHVLEMERVLMAWAAEAISTDDVAVTAVTDEERHAQAGLAKRMSVPQVIHGLLARRRDTSHLLEGLSESVLERPLFHPEWGALSVAMLFERVAEHEETHACQIKALRVEAEALTS